MTARLLLYVLIFSLVLSVLATGLQMLGELSNRRSELATTQQKVAEMMAGSLSSNLWLMNYSELANTLDDLLTLPSIQHAQLTTPGGENFIAGTYPSGDVLSQSFPLRLESTRLNLPQPLGTLTLTSSLSQVSGELVDRALTTLLLQSCIVLQGTPGRLLIVSLNHTPPRETQA
ncbi:MAG: hypothetical protein R3296_15135, partial [Oleiphilaceae bacterium]|nr:hypothetical protein [Oleiphilaceae bacterium]